MKIIPSGERTVKLMSNLWKVFIKPLLEMASYFKLTNGRS